MEYKNHNVVVDDDNEIDIPSTTSLSCNPPSIRGSAFSKPILSPSSSLISPRGGGDGGGSGTSAAKNDSLFGATPPSSVHPTPAAAADRSSQSAASARNSDPAAVGGATALNPKAAAAAAAAAKNSTSAASTNVSIRYRECLRNHAAAIGGHVLDGCGEFMPEGGASTPEALKCAACGCHRSFHRKEADGDAEATDSYYRGAARLPFLLPPPPLHQAPHHHQKQFQFGTPTTPSSGVVPFGGNASGSGGTTTESSSEERINAEGLTPPTAQRKRFRTKFTVDQKEKMLAFAERVGWRFQKQDEALVEQFCGEVGVRRQVLKVWMHNNKHLIRKQQQSSQQDEELLSQQQHQQQL